ncbi:hypothetical protein N7508_003162 [Penicillium antarcticum]|uniref:uncharacterized protein n=1 Tax=Penicillium antarcticum TaxID=416450 RepID=UPI00238604D3|nr:uncharacterized protein N7508_003162 [Penicillium antarcticum]KAJ5312332.1 hypothetical protein N7508_003162 [Penicillium antarcticum]
MGKWKAGPGLFLHAFTTVEDPASNYVTARRLRTDIDSQAAQMQIRTWFIDCKEHQCCCALSQDYMLPTRVIEVSPRGSQHARVLETRNMRGVYATLSYCWRNNKFPTLRNSNTARFTLGLNMNALPPTFRDAIATCRTLPIPFL